MRSISGKGETVMSEDRRVVVTRVGAITPVGNNANITWENLKNGKNGIAPITQFDTEKFKAKLGAEVKDFDPGQYLDVNDVLRTDRYAQLAVGAAQQAVEESGIEGKVKPERFAVLFGSGIGGIGTFEKEHTKLMERGPRRVSPLFVPMMIANMAAGMIAIRHDCRGTAMPAVTACASGSNAIGEAMRMIRHGYADAVITGGTEAAINASSVAGFSNMLALSTAENPDERPCRLISAEEDLSSERARLRLFWRSMNTQNNVERKFMVKFAVTAQPATHIILPHRIRKEEAARRQ